MANSQIVQAATAVNNRKTCVQRHWSVPEIERWMVLERPQRMRPNACRYQLSPVAPIGLSDRVSWCCKDGSIYDVSVAGYLRARSMWASLPIEDQMQS
jgi:hypothetical protein